MAIETDFLLKTIISDDHNVFEEQPMEEFEKVTSPAIFFRAFDLAFFVPGSIVMGTLIWWFRAQLWQPTGFDPQIYNASGILLIVGLLIATYVLGLTCHAMSRLVKSAVENFRTRRKRATSSNSTVVSASPESTFLANRGFLYDRLTYYWYLRSTCSNAAVAVAIASGISLYQISSQHGIVHVFGISVVSLIVVVALGGLAWEYDVSYEEKKRQINSLENKSGGFGSQAKE